MKTSITSAFQTFIPESKNYIMKPATKSGGLNSGIFILTFFYLFMTSSCAPKRFVNLRYTPLIQVQRLADKANPQVVVVGKFADARTDIYFGESNANSIGTIKYKYKSNDDLSALVRNAFVDGLLKSGFDVPMPNQQSNNALLTVSGRIVTYYTDTKTGFSKVKLMAHVVIEVTINPNTGNPVTFNVQGDTPIEQNQLLTMANVQSHIPDLLDRSLQECIRKFVEDSRFRGLIKV
jgi:Uncharacterized lipoprotein